MGVVFAALGVIAARTGAAFGQLLGHPAVAIGLAVFLLVLAASMFGAFELTLPEGLALRLNSVGGAGVAGAFLMGSVAGFLAAPCTGPVLTGLLTYVATTRTRRSVQASSSSMRSASAFRSSSSASSPCGCRRAAPGWTG